jgi:hypothetical protein
MEREVRRLEGLGQLGFDVYPPATVDESDPRQTGGEVFLDAEPRELFVGAQRLDGYLHEAGLGWVLRLGSLLAELDLVALTGRYQVGGRKAFHPRTPAGADRLRHSQPPMVAARVGRAGPARCRRLVVVRRPST